MTKVVNETTVDPAGLEVLRRPRTGFIQERQTGDTTFEAAEGPVERYRRTIDVTELPDGTARVVETIDTRLAVPYFRFLFSIGLWFHLRRPPDRRDRMPWWAPPDRVDPRTAQVLGTVSAIAVVGGYLGTLITQTITFAADEFDADDSAQGITLASVRGGIVLSLALLAVADRRGRRPLLLLTGVGGCVAAAVGAVAPNLVGLAVTQVVSRGFVVAFALLLTIVMAEEMPRSSRAYAMSVLGLASALGAGMCLWVLPVADLGERAWRVIYLVPLLGVPFLLVAGRRLPESRRFVRPHADATMAGHGNRFWLLAAAAFLIALFTTPASQFQNEFLRDERDYSALKISLFTVLTNTPAFIGVVVGARLADLRGRRVIGAIGLAGGVIFTVVMYLVSGWALWASSLVGAIIGGAVIPALGVYGPEMFPTALRGRANGLLSVLSVLGSGAGLLAAGALSDSLDGLGPAMTVLAAAPLLTAVLVVVAFPETAHLELEDINPEDRAAQRAAATRSRT